MSMIHGFKDTSHDVFICRLLVMVTEWIVGRHRCAGGWRSSAETSLRPGVIYPMRQLTWMKATLPESRLWAKTDPPNGHSQKRVSNPKLTVSWESCSKIIFLIYERGAKVKHSIRECVRPRMITFLYLSQTATFGPPLVKLVVKENSVTVKLKGPMRWKTGNITKDYSLLKFYPQMTYNLSVYDNRSNKTVGVT